MGHRTLSLRLAFRALFLDDEAFEELSGDDNPFVEGLFLVLLLGLGTALLALIGQALAWASTPRVAGIQQVVTGVLQQQAWWPQLGALAQADFQHWYDLAWQIFPVLSGVPDPARAALNLLLWPLGAVLSWLLYGALAHLFARLLGGRGTLNQTLGTTSLAFMPWVFRGLGIVPFVVLGGVLSTWQLLLRYKAVRTAHVLPWPRALSATLLPFAVYLIVWITVGAITAAALAVFAAGR